MLTTFSFRCIAEGDAGNFIQLFLEETVANEWETRQAAYFMDTADECMVEIKTSATEEQIRCVIDNAVLLPDLMLKSLQPIPAAENQR